MISWEAWTAGLWGQLVHGGRVRSLLLNHSQEHSVWHAVLEEDKELEGRQKDALAEMAADAWESPLSYNGQRACASSRLVLTRGRFNAGRRSSFVDAGAEGALGAEPELEDALRQASELRDSALMEPNFCWSASIP